MKAAAVASTLRRMCASRQAQVSSLLLLVRCSPVKAAVVRMFVEISCSGFWRGGKMTGQQTHEGCGSGKVSFNEWQSSLRGF